MEAGTIREFTYTLTPTIVEEDQGFDRLIVETPGQLLGVVNLRLTGRRLATIEKSMKTDGRYTTRWDGRDNQGRIFVPGLYVLQLTLETDLGTDHKYQPVSVVY